MHNRPKQRKPGPSKEQWSLIVETAKDSDQVLSDILISVGIVTRNVGGPQLDNSRRHGDIVKSISEQHEFS